MRRPPHIEHLPSGSLRIRIPDPFHKGQRIPLTADNETAILARRDAILAAIRDWKLNTISDAECRKAISRAAYGAPTLRDVWDAYQQTLRGEWGKSKVPAIWRSRVAPYFEKAKVFELTAPALARWERAELDKGLKPKTIVNAYHCIRAAVRLSLPSGTEVPWKGWRPLGPAKDSEQSQREACTSLDELRALMHAANRYDRYLEGKNLYADVAIRIFVAALTGARQGELAALGWDHLILPDELGPDDRAVGEIRIWKNTRPNWRQDHPAWTRPLDDPKGRRHRAHQLHAEVARALYDHRERLRRRGWYRLDGPVFPVWSADGRGTWRAQPETINGGVFRKIVDAAGLPSVERWSPHSLRHTFSTLTAHAAFMLTGDIQAARILTGHQDVKTLVGYLHRTGRGRPASLIGELGQASLPGLPSPAQQAVRELAERAQSVNRALSGLAEAIAVEDRPPTPLEVRRVEAKASLAELAAKYGSETPPVVVHRADARYRRAYNEAKRGGKAADVCSEWGKRARAGFLSAWRKQQKKAETISREVAT